jgi:DNA-binding transcriptional LysR family regulator
MELRQLAYFVAVAHEESFTRAAERLHVAQPGVSQQIRRLEAELGAPLFDRSQRRPRLTAAGAALLPHARDALAATDAGRQALAALHGIVVGRLTIGLIPGIPHLDVAGLLAAFHTKHPAVDMSLSEHQPVALLERLRRGEHDVVIVGLTSGLAPDGIAIEVLSVEPLVLVTAGEHPLAARKSVSVGELRGETFVSLTRNSTLRRHVEHACDVAGFAPQVALETTDTQLLCELVAAGLGVTIVPRSIVDASTVAGAAVTVVEIDPPVVDRHTALAWSVDRKLSSPADAFLALAMQWLRTT